MWHSVSFYSRHLEDIVNCHFSPAEIINAALSSLATMHIRVTEMDVETFTRKIVLSSSIKTMLVCLSTLKNIFMNPWWLLWEKITWQGQHGSWDDFNKFLQGLVTAFSVGNFLNQPLAVFSSFKQLLNRRLSEGFNLFVFQPVTNTPLPPYKTNRQCLTS